ncbi:hypothetical protein ACFP3U_10530, partial [Kitasatospora misakiensis]
ARRRAGVAPASAGSTPAQRATPAAPAGSGTAPKSGPSTGGAPSGSASGGSGLLGGVLGSAPLVDLAGGGARTPRPGPATAT